MDLHKPKPWHGWREFLKEYLIIVVGVLTALAFEAVVEELRWAERTRQTEAHLRAELHDITTQVLGRMAIQKCSLEMLDTLEAAFVQSGDDWRAPYVITGRAGGISAKMLITAPKGQWSTQAWRDAQADGTANHLPQADLLAFGGIFEQVEHAKTINEQEASDMAELNSLTEVRRLDTPTRAAYLRLMARVRQDLLGMSINSGGLLEQAADLKVAKGRLEDYGPAMGFYLTICRRFEAGDKDIAVTPGPLAAPK